MKFEKISAMCKIESIRTIGINQSTSPDCIDKEFPLHIPTSFNEKNTVQFTYLTRAEAASILRIGMSTMNKLIKSNDIPSYKIGHRVLISSVDLSEYIVAHQRTANKETNDV